MKECTRAGNGDIGAIGSTVYRIAMQTQPMVADDPARFRIENKQRALAATLTRRVDVQQAPMDRRAMP